MTLHQKFAAAALAVAVVSASPLFAQGKTQGADPIAWGALTGNSSCVLFAEGRKTSGRFYGVAVTTRSVGKLTLIEAIGTTWEQKEVLETQENLDSMMQTAQKEHTKFIEIPEKYSPEQLEKARALCKSSAAE